MGERASGWKRSARLLLGVAVATMSGSVASEARGEEPDWASLPYTLHSIYQAVDENGNGTFPVATSGAVKMRGVLLNNPEDMLPTAPGSPGFLGAIWQVFVQSQDPGDFGGTALFTAQNIGRPIGNHPAGSYTNEEWVAEMDRLNHDSANPTHVFRAGDMVEVRARAPGLFFNGKTNVNEQHSKDPALDFELRLISAQVGLPEPTLITLSDLKNDADQFLFAQDRLTGPEHYQGSLVRLQGVSLFNGDGWGPGGTIQVQDDTGRTINVLLGYGDGFTQFTPPTGVDGRFDVIGVFDQEDSLGSNGWKDSYRLWVMDYNGNAAVLPEPSMLSLLLAGSLVATPLRRLRRLATRA